MSMTTPFPQLLHAYFYDWLINQRNTSHYTIIAYRDTWRLFLRFVAQSARKAVAKLALADLGAAQVLAFLDHIETERDVSIATRNCRLAALRSFFTFVADREPLAAVQCAEVLRIPTKRAPQRELGYLETEEISAILAQPDCSTSKGQRDHTLLALLYNTGARIQEALDLCPRAIRLKPPAHVRLYGKGKKERLCPLWPETAELISALLQRSPCQEDKAIFVNRYGDPLGAAGVRYKLRQYVQTAVQQAPSLKGKRVTPHTFRHSAAVALIAAGVDVTVIRSWLGHVHLDTTNRYAQANLATKRHALEKITDGRPTEPARWKGDDELLNWLDEL
jgi:site-specific recombinase XerD